jgi:putative SOS response-associated peptidase YedK
MCGRLSSKSQREVIAKLYHATVTRGDHFPSFNVAPTQSAPIVREGPDHERTVDMAKFGIPTTAPGKTFLLINLQSEKPWRMRRERKSPSYTTRLTDCSASAEIDIRPASAEATSQARVQRPLTRSSLGRSLRGIRQPLREEHL